MSFSRENWLCRLARYCACSQSERCFPIALVVSCVARSFKRTDKHLLVIPI